MYVSSAIAAGMDPALLTGKQRAVSIRLDPESEPVFDTMFEARLPTVDPATLPRGGPWKVVVPITPEDIQSMEPPADTSMKMAAFATIKTPFHGKIEVSNAGYVSSDASIGNGWHLEGLDHLKGPALAQAIVDRLVERYGGVGKPAKSAVTQSDYDAKVLASRKAEAAKRPEVHEVSETTASLMHARQQWKNDQLLSDALLGKEAGSAWG